jgi:hypothetical protein
MELFHEVKPMSNLDIIELCKVLKIKNFKGVHMRNELKGKASPNESLILNLDDSDGNGTHWTSLFVKGKTSYYFDSFGLPPPKEVINYCPNNNNRSAQRALVERYYNTFKIQKPEEVICGHYCIYVLYKLAKGCKFYEILEELSKQ